MSIVAAIQMCSSTSLEENLKEAARLITQAVEQGAKLIVLPEMFTAIAQSRETIAFKEFFGHGPIQAFLAEQAQYHKIWLVGGTIPIIGTDLNKAQAACLVFDDNGKCVARYNKIHLFDVDVSEKEIYRESDTIEAGKNPVVISTPFGKLGLAVCYDLRFPELFRFLCDQGAEIIVIPAAFTVTTGEAHWQLLTRCRAVENLCYVIGACQGGLHACGRQTYGHSLVISPWGEILAEQKEPTPGVICASIDLVGLHQLRRTFPVLKHKKQF